MIGVIDFLRKTKEICEMRAKEARWVDCQGCVLEDLCGHDMRHMPNEADIVTKVMEHEIKEDEQC